MKTMAAPFWTKVTLQHFSSVIWKNIGIFGHHPFIQIFLFSVFLMFLAHFQVEIDDWWGLDLLWLFDKLIKNDCDWWFGAWMSLTSKKLYPRTIKSVTYRLMIENVNCGSLVPLVPSRKSCRLQCDYWEWQCWNNILCSPSEDWMTTDKG